MSQNKNIKNEALSFKNSLIAVVLLLIAFFSYSKYAQIQKDNQPVAITVSAADHTIGKADAKVSIIEFADMQCPACRAFEPIVSQVIAEYAAKPNSQVKFTYKHFPLIAIHQNTMIAAIGSEAAAKQGKFWEYKKVVFENQDKWGNALDAKDKIKSYLAAIGIDTVKWEQDLNDATLEDHVMSDLKEAVAINLTGTPSFVINGIKVDVSQLSTLEKFKTYIDAELAK